MTFARARAWITDALDDGFANHCNDLVADLQTSLVGTLLVLNRIISVGLESSCRWWSPL